MNENKYSVWHCNGQGVYSQWYRDAIDLSKEQAEAKKRELEQKADQGWFAVVSVFPNDAAPNYE